MLRFYDREVKETPNSLAAKQAQETLANLSISDTVKEEMKAKLEKDDDFSQFINESSLYLKPFYEKHDCESIHLLSLDIVSFYIFLKFKQIYDAFQNKEKDFNSSLKIFMGYLCALAKAMDKDKNTTKVYHPTLGNQDSYALFFCDQFDEKMFKNKNQFDDFRYGLEGAKKLLKMNNEPDGTLSFSFISKQVFDYFVSANPRALLEGRADVIKKFINEEKAGFIPKM